MNKMKQCTDYMEKHNWKCPLEDSFEMDSLRIKKEIFKMEKEIKKEIMIIAREIWKIKRAIWKSILNIFKRKRKSK